MAAVKPTGLSSSSGNFFERPKPGPAVKQALEIPGQGEEDKEKAEFVMPTVQRRRQMTRMPT